MLPCVSFGVYQDSPYVRFRSGEEVSNGHDQGLVKVG